MAWRSLCAKNSIGNQEVVRQVKEITRPLPVQHRQKTMSTLAGTQCVDCTWKALKHYLPTKKLMKNPQSPSGLFRTPIPRVGLAKELGPLDRKDFFAAADQNLVKTAVVYSHFAEEDIQRSRHRNSHGIAMISARHGHPQIVI